MSGGGRGAWVAKQLCSMHIALMTHPPSSLPCCRQVLDKFTSLPHLFTAFRQCLVDSGGMLKKHKEKFRSGLLQDAEDFKRTVNDLVEAFESGGPFTSEATQEQVRGTV